MEKWLNIGIAFFAFGAAVFGFSLRYWKIAADNSVFLASLAPPQEHTSQDEVQMVIIGQRTRHVDWRSITNGSAKYAADIHLNDELTAAVLRSPHPHARIVSIDTAKARKIPGVHAVLTAADITNRMYIDYRGTDQNRRVLATDTVR